MRVELARQIPFSISRAYGSSLFSWVLCPLLFPLSPHFRCWSNPCAINGFTMRQFSTGNCLCPWLALLASVCYPAFASPSPLPIPLAFLFPLLPSTSCSPPTGAPIPIPLYTPNAPRTSSSSGSSRAFTTACLVHSLLPPSLPPWSTLLALLCAIVCLGCVVLPALPRRPVHCPALQRPFPVVPFGCH